MKDKVRHYLSIPIQFRGEVNLSDLIADTLTGELCQRTECYTRYFHPFIYDTKREQWYLFILFLAECIGIDWLQAVEEILILVNSNIPTSGF